MAAVRLAVRSVGLPREAGETVMVACSGGADSLALLAATVFELRRSGTRVIGAVVDHGLQSGSRERTDSVVAQMAALGVDETASIRVRRSSGRSAGSTWPKRLTACSSVTPGTVVDRTGATSRLYGSANCGDSWLSGRAGKVALHDAEGTGASLCATRPRCGRPTTAASTTEIRRPDRVQPDPWAAMESYAAPPVPVADRPDCSRRQGYDPGTPVDGPAERSFTTLHS